MTIQSLPVHERTRRDIILEAARMISYATAAEMLGVNKRTIRRRVAAGRYIAYGDGAGKRLLLSSILRDIEQQTRRAL